MSSRLEQMWQRWSWGRKSAKRIRGVCRGKEESWVDGRREKEPSFRRKGISAKKEKWKWKRWGGKEGRNYWRRTPPGQAEGQMHLSLWHLQQKNPPAGFFLLWSVKQVHVLPGSEEKGLPQVFSSCSSENLVFSVNTWLSVSFKAWDPSYGICMFILPGD